MATNFVNYYKILQVDSEAEIEVIDVAYKKLALKYHPDYNKASDADEKMKGINEAKRVLTNPQERSRYDQQFAQYLQSQQAQSQTSSASQETVVDDFDDSDIRNLALEILRTIQKLLNEKKWRVAKEKLYVFDGLGIPSKDHRIPSVFTMAFPEWQNAKRLNDLANEQSRKFGTGLAIWSSLIYGFGLGFIGMLWFGIATISNNNDIGMGILAGLFGAVAGFVVGVIAALIGTWVYSANYAGKWGEGADMILGISAPLLLALVITFGIYIILAYFIIGGFLSSLSSGNKKR